MKDRERFGTEERKGICAEGYGVKGGDNLVTS